MRYAILFLLFYSTPVLAIECNMKTRGSLTCMENKLCKCDYVNPGLMTNDPGGYRWDCGINRPQCMDPNIIDSSKPYDGPEAVGIDSSTENNSTIINN